MELLSEGFGKAAVVRLLSEKHSLCLRQARRYVNSAALELMCEPFTTTNLDASIALDLDRLDLLTFQAMQNNETKTAIAATKAKASIAINRLRALEQSLNVARRIERSALPF